MEDETYIEDWDPKVHGWIMPGELEAEELYQDRYHEDGKAAVEHLWKLPGVKYVRYEGTIPLSMYIHLDSGEMIKARNARVGGNVSCVVFDHWCYDTLHKEWPPVIWRGEREADAWKFIDIARELKYLIEDYQRFKCSK